MQTIEFSFPTFSLCILICYLSYQGGRVTHNNILSPTIYEKNYSVTNASSFSCSQQKDHQCSNEDFSDPNGRKSLETESSQDQNECFNNMGECSSASSLSVDDVELIRSFRRPNCQQLQVDIDHIQGEMLNSSDKLTSILVELSIRTSFTLLSHQCNPTPYKGFSCIGIIGKGHISFHVWPSSGVVSIDIFSCDNHPILSMLPIIQDLFGIVDTFSMEYIQSHESNSERIPENTSFMRWCHKVRGYHDSKTDNARFLESDKQKMLERIDLQKELITGVQTDYQLIDIFDSIDPQYYGRKSSNSTFHRMQAKDRMVYTDGELLTKSSEEESFHEVLVQPVMFTHPNPKRVLIIGGGTGATLREVLKHNTVQKVIIIEKDKALVKLSREYLPSWSDCSNLIGSAVSCFDDPRVEVYFDNAVQWLQNRFGKDSRDIKFDEFDVVILDILKLNSKVVKGDIFNEDFAESISRVLGESGILVSQIGDVNIKDKLPVIYSEDLSSTFIHSLLEKDFQLVMQYAGSRQKSLSPWKFVVAMKDKTSRGNWHSSESKVLVEMNKRTLSTKNGDTFRYFDDVTMKSVEFPTRIMEDNFCVDHQDLEYCYKDHGFDPDIPDFSSDSFEVGISSVANGGRGVFSKEFIPKGSYIGMQNCVSTLFIPPNQLSVLNSVKDQFSDNEFLTCLAVGYLEGYGWIESTYGAPSGGVDSAIFTFANHGCHGTNNAGTKLNYTEMDIDITKGPQGEDEMFDDFNIYKDRHFPLWDCDEYTALRDIQAGEELLDNYLTYGGVDFWEVNVLGLQEVCSGGIGLVSLYEKQEESQQE